MNEMVLVCIVDDDESVRDSLPDFLQQFGFAAQAFSSALNFLGSELVDEASCVIVDVAMPDMSGPELHRELRRLGKAVRVIFITGQGDERVRQDLIAGGAVDCLSKPFSEAALLDAIDAALQEG